MSSEVLKRDENHVPVIGLVTDDASQEIRMGRIDDTTKGLKVMLVGGVGGGNVVGPASSTDNAITRFDGTSGTSIQNSTVILDDAGAITGITTINGFHPTYSGSDSIIDSTGGDFTKISTALAATPSTGLTYYTSDGTITETVPISITRSATQVNISNGATIQVNGASVSPFFSPSTTGFSRTMIHGGKILQTNATVQGIAFNMSDMPNSWVGQIRIEGFGTAIQIIDAASTSFYSSFRDIQIFDCNNGISLGGSQPNLNLWDNVRIRPKAGGAGTGVNLVDTRGNVFLMVDAEPATGTGITGFHIDGTSRDNLFMGIWAENNANGLVIDSGANNNVFIGGSITSNLTTDITDNGTNTTMIGVNKTGTKVYRLPKLTDIQGLNLVTFTETAVAVNNFNIANAAAGGAPVLSAIGTDTDINITITPKGAGVVVLGAALPLASGGTAGTTAATARANLLTKYTINFACANSTPVSDATTYYFGFPYDVSFLNTTPAIRQKIFPFSGIVRGAAISVTASSGATTETSTISIRINNTTDVTLSSAVTMDQTAQQFSVTGLTQTINAGDKIEIKLLTPTWVTNPTNVRISVDLYLE